jgi:hypothetical protein
MIASYFEDRKHRLPRKWSNKELSKISHIFTGDVVNVSAWKDIDKEGRRYRDYFENSRSYSITNYYEEERGYQGYENEVFLDLEDEIGGYLEGSFDVVFNHTVLEHIYYVQKAFTNLCKMTRDIVILVIPFVQHRHAEYGDYWRFTPIGINRMFNERGMDVLYLNFNDHKNASVYIFAVASKNKEKWRGKIEFENRKVDKSMSHIDEPYAGCNAIQNQAYRLKKFIASILRG